MREALPTVLVYALRQARYPKLTAHVMPGNDASRRLLVALGFASKGLFKELGRWRGKRHDLERFVLLNA